MENDWTITPDELKSELEQGKSLFLLDVREKHEWDQTHMEGATLIPLKQLEARSSEIDKNREIIVYCAHGMRSLEGVMILRQKGFNRLKSLEGGIVEWNERFPNN